MSLREVFMLLSSKVHVDVRNAIRAWRPMSWRSREPFRTFFDENHLHAFLCVKITHCGATIAWHQRFCKHLLIP